MAGAGVKEFNSANFENEVLKAKSAVLVDFWAPWCGPCRMIAPLVEQLASEVGDTYGVGKLNIDDASDIAGRFGISAIPTLLVFKNGEVVHRVVGASVKKDDLKKALEAA